MKTKKYHKFCLKDWFNLLRTHGNINTTALFYLLSQMDEKNEIHKTLDLLCFESKISKPTFYRTFKSLESANIIIRSTKFIRFNPRFVGIFSRVNEPFEK